MYLDFQVKIPTESAGITRKKIKGTTYIYYAYEHNYNTEKGYTVPKNTTIGKCTDDDSELMYPNTNFLKFFPAEELLETKGSAYRSGCLRAGTYFVLRKIIAEYGLNETLGDIIGKSSGLFLDLAVLTNMYSGFDVRSELLKSNQFYNNVFDTAVNYEDLMNLKKELKKI